MLQEGDYKTLEEIADAENINPSYVSRLLRMTLLAPEVVDAILAGRQPAGLTMVRAIQPFPSKKKYNEFVQRPLVRWSITLGDPNRA